MDLELCAAELKNFLDSEGRLKGYPTKYKLKIFALFYLAGKFAQGKRYSEIEVNGILKQWHTFNDWALLRRELYDRGIFCREKDCSAYWLEANPPPLSAFGL